MALPASSLPASHPTLGAVWDILRARWKKSNLHHLETYFSSYIHSSYESFAPTVQTRDYPLDEIASLYESGLTDTTVGREGILYTPPSVARSIARYLQITLQQTILDPACGCGTFLIAAAQHLLDVTNKTEVTAPYIIAQHIYGVDKDISAVLIAKMTLATLLCEHSSTSNHTKILQNLDRNIVCGDMLIPESSFSSNHWVLKQNTFDFIIGNPPYGLSRGQKLSSDENKILKEKYKQYRNGRVNKYLLFMGRSYELLRDGGSSALIVPNAWLGIKEAQKLRELLLTQGGLSRIEFLPKSTFQSAGVETVIVYSQKGVTNQEVDVVREKNISKISKIQCLKLPGSVLPTFWNNAIGRFVSTLSEYPQKFNGTHPLCTPRIALQAYAAGKGSPPQTTDDAKLRSFHSRIKHNENYAPYLEGRDVTPFRIEWSGEFLRYGSWLAEPQCLSRFQGPRILIREIIQRPPALLIAAYTSDLYLYNKSILHILPAAHCSEETLKALTALLQSSTISTWLRIIGRKTGRTLFPKIVLDDLLTLPIPEFTISSIATLASLTDEAQLSFTPSLAKKIDEVSCALYSLRLEDIKRCFV